MTKEENSASSDEAPASIEPEMLSITKEEIEKLKKKPLKTRTSICAFWLNQKTCGNVCIRKSRK